MNYKAKKYTLQELSKKQVVNHDISPITDNHIILDNTTSSKQVMSHLLNNLLYRLETTKEQYYIHIVGNGLLTDNKKRKGYYTKDNVDKFSGEELSLNYLGKFKTKVIAHEKGNGIQELMQNIYVQSNRKFPTIMFEKGLQTLGSFHISDEFFQDVVVPYVEENNEYIEFNTYPEYVSYFKERIGKFSKFFDTELLTTNITVITENPSELNVQERRLYPTTVFNHNLKTHIIGSVRIDDTIFTSNHITVFTENELDTVMFNEEPNYMESNIPRYATNHNYAINSLQAQTIFNEFNHVLTSKKTEHSMTVTDLENGTLKEFVIEEKVQLFMYLYQNLNNRMLFNSELTREYKDLLRDLTSDFIEQTDWEQQVTKEKERLNKLLSFDVNVERMSSIMESASMEYVDGNKEYTKLYKEATVRDILKFSIYNKLVLYSDRDDRKRELLSRLMAVTVLKLDSVYRSENTEFDLENHDITKKDDLDILLYIQLLANFL